MRLGGGGEGGRNTTLVTQTVVGTSAYMAPEAVRGDVTVLLGKTNLHHHDLVLLCFVPDVYSFGVVLLELLTGLPPIDNDRDPPDLVGYLDELEEGGDIENLLDHKFPKSEWRQVSAKKIYQISQDCLKKKKERPRMELVCERLFSLYQ